MSIEKLKAGTEDSRVLHGNESDEGDSDDDLSGDDGDKRERRYVVSLTVFGSESFL
jgi:hypothetical protein